MTILEEIVQHKKRELQDIKSLISIDELTKSRGFAHEVISVSQYLKDPEKTGIIAEFKRQSPSKGIINDRVDVLDVTSAYEKAGASATSILTDFKYFGGAVDDILKVRDSINIPILRKEFIVDEYQLYEAKSIGADVILLIAACLSVDETKQLAAKARELGLEVLLELHAEEELGHVNSNVNVVGINNRNLKTFEVSLEHSIKLAEQIQGDFVKISESGIKTTDDILYLKEHGFEGFLIGESFMKSENPGKAFNDFIQPLKK